MWKAIRNLHSLLCGCQSFLEWGSPSSPVRRILCFPNWRLNGNHTLTSWQFLSVAMMETQHKLASGERESMVCLTVNNMSSLLKDIISSSQKLVFCEHFILSHCRQISSIFLGKRTTNQPGLIHSRSRNLRENRTYISQSWIPRRILNFTTRLILFLEKS